MFRIIRFLIFFLLTLLSFSCKEDEGVGMSVQPSEDVLQTFSNKIDVVSSSIVSDSVLSKSDNLFLGRYRDAQFGESSAEFMSQLDARIGGVHVPDTTVVTSTSSSVGILNTLLTSVNSSYGSIQSIYDAKEITVDSVNFYIQYSDDHFGDSTSLQAVSVYELNAPLKDNRYFTNTSLSDYCDKSLLLGKTTYQVKNSRVINVPLNVEVGKRLMSVYQKGSSVTSQEDFNDLFKGVYVSHTFNEGSMIQITVAGIQVYYHYDAKIKTTFNDKDTILLASKVQTKEGKFVNPLVSSFFLSANKAVNRVNLIQQENLSSLVDNLNQGEYTYTLTPAGLYTSLSIPFQSIMDSVKRYESDSSRIMFNSARLIVHRQDLNWKTDLKSSTYLMLVGKSNLVDFFYNNMQPDGVSSFVAAIDTSKNTYSFNITASVQNRMRNLSDTYDDDLVLVPIVRTSDGSQYYYRQQLWLTSTMLYSSNATSEALRPRLDIVYTCR